MFNGEQNIKTSKLQDYSIVGDDKSGQTAKLLDYISDGKVNGYVDKKIFIGPTKINNKVFEMDPGYSGNITNNELYHYIDGIKSEIGDEKLQEIYNSNIMEEKISNDNNQMANNATSDFKDAKNNQAEEESLVNPTKDNEFNNFPQDAEKANNETTFGLGEANKNKSTEESLVTPTKDNEFNNVPQDAEKANNASINLNNNNKVKIGTQI